ncbi:hypothetical protein HDV05_006742 [Chytridiales sp. JEL 0842]|nr:hypothetical protein HDV05_006742 [Chytridiales sp. JEL 0842]
MTEVLSMTDDTLAVAGAHKASYDAEDTSNVDSALPLSSETTTDSMKKSAIDVPPSPESRSSHDHDDNTPPDHNPSTVQEPEVYSPPVTRERRQAEPSARKSSISSSTRGAPELEAEASSGMVLTRKRERGAKDVGGVSSKKLNTGSTYSSNQSLAGNNNNDKSGADANAPLYRMNFADVDDKFLRKYRRVLKVKSKKTPITREELVESVTRHFDSQEVNEKDSITSFIYSVRNQGVIWKKPLQLFIKSSI